MRAALLLLLGFAACKAPPQPPAPLAAPGDSADMIAYGMKTYISRSGVLVSTVTADTAWFYQANQITPNYDLRGMKVTFHDSAGHIQSTITSKRGTLRAGKEEELDARDSVVAVTPQGDTLRTKHLVWSKGNNQIYSDSAFTHKSPTSMTRGTQFTATPDFKSIIIGKPSGRQLPAKKTPTPKTAPAKNTAPKGKTPR